MKDGTINESIKNNSQYALKFKQSNLFLDIKEKENYARFANYSCDPNCKMIE